MRTDSLPTKSCADSVRTEPLTVRDLRAILSNIHQSLDSCVLQDLHGKGFDLAILADVPAEANLQMGTIKLAIF